jgi:hypothetical protein
MSQAIAFGAFIYVLAAALVIAGMIAFLKTSPKSRNR